MTRPNIPTIVDAVLAVTGRPERPLGLHEPWFAGRERDYVLDCLDAGWISSVGTYVDRFEQEVAAACGAAHGVAVVNGTAALHTALLLVGVARDEEVIVPALTFVATANAVCHAGAVPHFVDSAADTLGLCPRRLADHLAATTERRADGALVNRATGRRIAAVVPVHVFGHPVDMDPLRALCDELGLPVIEDATEALGSTYKGRGCGSLSRIGVFSFNGNKILTTGGGGAIVTDDADLARRAKHLTTTAKKPHRWAFDHDEVAFNYRMPNLNAAVGCAQLEQLPRFVELKRTLAARYQEVLAGLPGVAVMREPAGSRSNYWLNAVLLDATAAGARDALLEASHAAGLMTRPVWSLMHRQPMFAKCPRADLSVAEDLERRIVNLPSSAFLATAERPAS